MAAPQSEFQLEPGQGRPTREVAARVFATEFNASNLEYKESGERSPTFVVTPLGARVNRLFVVGVLTSNEKIGAGGDMWRAQVTDPTGVFNVYAGQYQPEAARALSEIRPPAVVAVVGKSRTYAPEDGVVYTSIRPESVKVVGVEERDRWIVETARHTLRRIDAIRESQKLGNPTEQAIEELGYTKEVAEGIVKAIAHYKDPELGKYAAMLKDALESLLPGTAAAARAAAPEFTTPTMPAPAAPGAPAGASAPNAAPAKAAPPANPKQEENENVVFALVEGLDDGKGAPWEDIVAQAAKKKVTEADVEEALNALMDKGLIYEPVLGKLKKT